jgi:hypothetical protein
MESQKIQVPPAAEYDTNGTRLTCVAIAGVEYPPESLTGKRKRD